MSRSDTKSEQRQKFDYWSETRTPLSSLVFLLPLLICYEVGVFLLGGHQPESLRNGADIWMRDALLQIGLQHASIPPLLVVVGLIVWQYAGKFRWRFSTDTILGMFSESLLFALCLIVISRLQHLCFEEAGVATLAIGLESSRPIISNCMGYIGAGIYEEFLFRLVLLPACYLFFLSLRVHNTIAAGIAVAISCFGFTLAHYVQPADLLSVSNVVPLTLEYIVETPELWFGFVFRMIAGVFFSLLFLLRGFGITVGAHACYDVIVGVVLANEIG